MKDDGTFDALWILKKCIWCGKSIIPEALEHTTDEQSGRVYFQHNKCPQD